MKNAALLKSVILIAGIGGVFLSYPQNLCYAQTNDESCQSIVAPFNVGEIIEKVSHYPVREGATFIIKDRSYEAFFDEDGIILKPRETKGDAEDLVIPLIGKPELKDGKVVYQTEHGEVIFEGNNRGLRFEHNLNDTLHFNYSGNIAKLTFPSMSGKRDRSTRTGEFILDTNLVYVQAYYGQMYPSIAFDGTNYLVVWQDDRRITLFPYVDIFAARVSQSGTLLDSAGIAISTASHDQKQPSVIFGGTNYLVVWRDCRDYSTTTTDIYGARVSQLGILLDTMGIVISADSTEQTAPSVSFDGTNYLVVWQERLSGSDIYGARVDQAGVVLDTTGIVISSTPENQVNPSVDFDGSNFLVVWGTADIYGTRVSPSGIVLDTLGIVISAASNNQRNPCVTFDSKNYLVVWEDRRSGVSYDIYGARLDTSGVVLDTSGIAISVAPNHQYNPAAASVGMEYLVVWDDKRNGNYSDIYGARLDTSGVVLDTSGIAISTNPNYQEYASIASDGTNWLVVWHDYYCRGVATCGARVDQSGTVLEPTGLIFSCAANDQWSPAVAFDGTNYLVVWHDYRSDESFDIYGVRVDTSGTVLDPSCIAICTASNDQNDPSVVFDNTNFFVVWSDGRNGSDFDIYGAQVSQSGTVPNPSGISISNATGDQMTPAVAFDGTNYLVVWSDRRSGIYNIYAARVNQTGTVLDPSGIAISTVNQEQRYPAVAFDGTNYLVVWENKIFIVEFYDIYGARVDTSGTVLDPSGLLITPKGDEDWYPAVAFDGTNYLVVWAQSSLPARNIYGARVDTSGTLLDSTGIAISSDNFYQQCPALIFDGTEYVVVWEEWSVGIPSWSDIYGARVTPEGEVTDSFAVTTQFDNQSSPTLAHGPGDQVLITYASFTYDINGHPVNTSRIWGKYFPFIGITEDEEYKIKDTGLSLQTYPNPFNKKININYSAGYNANDTELKIYDVTGSLVRTLEIDRSVNSQINHISWDGADEYGEVLPAGVYIIRLTEDNFFTTKKIIKVY